MTFFLGTKTFSKVAPHIFSQLISEAAKSEHSKASELDRLRVSLGLGDVILSFVTASCYVLWRHVKFKQRIFCENMKVKVHTSDFVLIINYLPSKYVDRCLPVLSLCLDLPLLPDKDRVTASCYVSRRHVMFGRFNFAITFGGVVI